MLHDCPWCPFIISHISSCFTVRFTFLSPLSLRHGFVVVRFEVTICELLCLDGLRHVISGILAGGSLVSAWCFCCFAHLLVWPCDFDVLSFVSAAIPCQDDTMLSLLLQFAHELASVTPLFGCFVWVAVFYFVLVVCFLFLFSACGDFVTDYWTMRRSFISSLLRPLNLQTAMYALIN